MRPTHLARTAAVVIVIVIVIACCTVGPALAQSTFSVEGRSNGVSTPPSPTVRRSFDAGTATTVDGNPATGAAGAAGAAAVRYGPRPFDVDGDGDTPVVALPEDEPAKYPRASTTVSPLSRGAIPDAVALDARGPAQRRDLARILREAGDVVREFRVAVDNEAEFVDAVVDRPIVPGRAMQLDGERDLRSWTVFLSAAEASRGGTLSLAFTNSVVVLPEASQLRLFLNGRQVAQTAIDSPDRTKVVALPIPAEMLRAGENAFRIEAEMRHRIDCSLDATYELWTRIDPRLTGFSAGGSRAPLAGLADLPAVGVGTNGATRLRVIVDQPQDVTQIDRMLRATQAAALRGRFVQPLVEVVPSAAGLDSAPGTLNIAIGTFDTLSRIVDAAPAAAGTTSTLQLVYSAIGPTVVISGPSERDVDTALARFDPAQGGAEQGGATVETPPWVVPDSTRIDGAESITLRQAGLETIDFSGRRLRASFNVTLPPDFYAAAYGEAKMILDAAYTAAAEPGSQLTVFVNGVPSSSLAFTSSDGEVFDDFPVALGLQAFRPGINTVEIIAEIQSASDRACLPGGTVPSGERFALLSSTRLTFPRFARVGQLPNLASFTSNGFPYPMSADPVRVRIAGSSPDTIGAAGTLISRIAVSRGAPLATNVVEDVEPFRDKGLIIIAPLADVPRGALDATGATAVVPGTWLSSGPAPAPGIAPEGPEPYDAVLQRLRQQLRQDGAVLDAAAPALGESIPAVAGEGVQARERWFEDLLDDGLSGMVSRATRSVRRALNLDFDDEGGQPSAAPPVPDQATLILAQSAAPESETTAWTLITAPTPGLLSTSLAALTAPEAWDRIGGRATAYTLGTDNVDVVPVGRVSYLATLPLSVSNLRLIAANWFSLNNGVYALVLVAAGLVLGVLTWVLVRPLGRKN